MADERLHARINRLLLGQVVLVLLTTGSLVVHNWLLHQQLAVLHAVVQTQTDTLRLHRETLESLTRTSVMTTETLTLVSQSMRDAKPSR